MSSPDLECYVELAFKLDSNFRFFDEDFDLIPIDLTLDFCLSATLAHAINNDIDPDFVVPGCRFDFNLWKSLQKLEQEIPDYNDDHLFSQWIKQNSQAWTEKYRSLMIKYRNIGYDWQFNEEQNKLLEKYSDANELLVDCLNSGCKVSPNVRDEIEQTLLLPISEINPR